MVLERISRGGLLEILEQTHLVFVYADKGLVTLGLIQERRPPGVVIIHDVNIVLFFLSHDDV